MGFFNKLMFWKKDEDEIDFEHLTKKELGNDPLKEIDSGNKPSFDTNLSSDPLQTEPSNFNPNNLSSSNLMQEEIKTESIPLNTRNEKPDLREHELINSKLDTIKALLNSLDQRIANIEKVTGAEKEKPKNLW